MPKVFLPRRSIQVRVAYTHPQTTISASEHRPTKVNRHRSHPTHPPHRYLPIACIVFPLFGKRQSIRHQPPIQFTLPIDWDPSHRFIHFLCRLIDFISLHSPSTGPKIIIRSNDNNNKTTTIMIALKPLLLALLTAGTSSAFAVMQPQAPVATLTKTSVLKMSGGAADAPPPELKVRDWMNEKKE